MAFSNGLFHIYMQVLDDQIEPIYNSSERIRDVAWKTCRKRWTIETRGERALGKPVLATQYDDDDDDMRI